MGSLLAHLLPLAIGAACSPVVLGMAIELLAVDPDRGRRNAAWYLAGFMSPIVVLAALGVFVDPSLLGGDSAGADRVVDVVDVVLGVVLVALGCWLVARRRRGTTSPEAPVGAAKLMWLGIGMMFVNVSTVVLVVAGLREIVIAQVGTPVEILGAVVLVAGAMAPVVVPLVIDLAAPGPSRRVLDPAQRLVARHGTAIAAAVSFGFGAYLIGRGARIW